MTPFLPGDSLLFATGALCATGALNTPTAFALLPGRRVHGQRDQLRHRTRWSARECSGRPRRRACCHRLLNREHLERAHTFFERYGGKALILGRFVPIVRTFVPFVAGAAQMPSRAFVLYNLVGAVGWVALCVGAGIAFGNVPVVREHFSLVTLGIVAVSLLPMVIELIRHRR